jgi:hypothetical protein
MIKRPTVKTSSSAPGFRWTSRWDIISVQTQEPEPMCDTMNPGERGRFSSQRKTAAVLRLLRGEDLELVSRELGVTAATRLRKRYREALRDEIAATLDDPTDAAVESEIRDLFHALGR